MEDGTVRRYVAKSLQKRGESLALNFLLIAIPFHLASLSADSRYLPAALLPHQVVYHLSIACASILILAVGRWGVPLRHMTYILQIAVFLPYVYLQKFAADMTPSGAIYTGFGLAVTNAYIMFTFPLGVRAAWMTCAVYAAFSYYMTVDIPNADVWQMFQLEAVGIGFLYWLQQSAHILQRARHDVDGLFKIAPVQVVRKFIESDQPMQVLFAPKIRRCVCISSDWRNFQKMSREDTPQDLRRVMERYYTHVEGKLQEMFPEGNFFSDWIADELFLIIYCEEDDQGREYTNQALKFCRALLQQKGALFPDASAAPGIDVGMTLGETLVGMIGPPGHQKATALGELPGRSRRLQQVGKVLRQEYGDSDRIIFGNDILMSMLLPYPVRPVQVKAEWSLRDLPDADLYCLEPTREEELIAETEQARAQTSS